MVTALGGEEMAYKIAGGTKWWQVRAGPGVEAEWIVLKKDWKDYQKAKDKGAQLEKDKDKEKGKERETAPEEAREIEDESGECG